MPSILIGGLLHFFFLMVSQTGTVLISVSVFSFYDVESQKKEKKYGIYRFMVVNTVYFYTGHVFVLFSSIICIK